MNGDYLGTHKGNNKDRPYLKQGALQRPKHEVLCLYSHEYAHTYVHRHITHMHAHTWSYHIDRHITHMGGSFYQVLSWKGSHSDALNVLTHVVTHRQKCVTAVEI